MSLPLRLAREPGEEAERPVFPSRHARVGQVRRDHGGDGGVTQHPMCSTHGFEEDFRTLSIVRNPRRFNEVQTITTEGPTHAIWDVHIVFPTPAPVALTPSQGAHRALILHREKISQRDSRH